MSNYEAIEKIVKQHGENLLKQDAKALLDAFDKDYECVTHLPTEAETFLRSLDEIRDYYLNVCTTFRPSSWRVEDLLVDFPSENVAFAICRVFVEYQIDGVSEDELVPFHSPRGYWEGRCRYVFRRSTSGWKIIHLEDSTCEMFRALQLSKHLEG